MNTLALRRLPSADWIAFGLAVAALCLQYVYPVAFGLIALAVFAPSVLREIGLLNDTDEWSTGIMHRAGFHGLLAVGGLISLNYLVIGLNLFQPDMHMDRPFGTEMIRKAVVWVFLVSYIIQYWGAREGVFRILLVTALVGLAPLLAFRQYPDLLFLQSALLATSAQTLVMVGLALLVRRRPRVGGVVLIALLGAITLALLWTNSTTEAEAAKWGVSMVWLQAGLIFGITGVALLREK